MGYKALTKHFEYHTTKRLEFIPITSQVEEVIKNSGVRNGAVVIQTHHTTCGVWVNEDEKNLIGHHNLTYVADLHKILDKFASPEDDYSHNDVKDHTNPSGKRDTHLCEPDSCGIIHECKNGHAHAQAMLIPHSVNMIIENGSLLKGRWQQIMLVELDHDRPRKYSVHVQGSTE